MDNLLHIGGMIVTALFVAAVIYSLFMALRRHQMKRKAEKAVANRVHVQVKNLHDFDILPTYGYYKYPLGDIAYTRRHPLKYTAVSLALATEQPYSIYLLGVASFDAGKLVSQHYFYIQPPENDLSHVKHADVTWNLLSKADEFGEYWQAGMKDLFIGKILVCDNAPFVIGCITHALTIYGIDVPMFRFIDTREMAKKLYRFPSHKLEDICEELHIDIEPGNCISEARALGQFYYQTCKDYPMYAPRVGYVGGTPSEEEVEAGLISVVEREEKKPDEMFEFQPVDMNLIKELIDKKYIEPGEVEGTYYATDAGLDFSEQLP